MASKPLLEVDHIKSRRREPLQHYTQLSNPNLRYDPPRLNLPTVDSNNIDRTVYGVAMRDTGIVSELTLQGTSQNQTMTTHQSTVISNTGKTCTTTISQITTYLSTTTISVDASLMPITTSNSLSLSADECAIWVTVYKDNHCKVCEDDAVDYVIVGLNTVTVTIDSKATTTADTAQGSESRMDANPSPNAAPATIKLTTATLTPTATPISIEDSSTSLGLGSIPFATTILTSAHTTSPTKIDDSSILAPHPEVYTSSSRTNDDNAIGIDSLETMATIQEGASRIYTDSSTYDRPGSRPVDSGAIGTEIVLPIATTFTDAQGQPVSTKRLDEPATRSLDKIADETGVSETMTTILLDAEGHPTDTRMLVIPNTRPPNQSMTRTETAMVIVTTLTNPLGHPTATMTFSTSTAHSYYTNRDEVEFLTMMTTTLTDSQGIPTATSTYLAYASKLTETWADINGKPTRTETLAVLQSGVTSVLSDTEGIPTRTMTYFWLPSTTILTDSQGKPTGTRTTLAAETVSTSVLVDVNGNPTGTVTALSPDKTPVPTSAEPKTSEPSSTDNDNDTVTKELLQVYGITNGQYFVGLILPALLATILGVPIRVLDCNAKLYQPFHALARASSNGATAQQSLLFETNGLKSTMRSFFTCQQGYTLLRLTGALTLLSTILVPVSVEAVRVIIQGDDCREGQGNAQNCAITLGSFPVPAYIVVALLSAMATLVIAVAVVLRKWDTGVSSKPWSLYMVTEIASDEEFLKILSELRKTKRTIDATADLSEVLGRQRYGLRFWKDGGAPKFAITIQESCSPKLLDKASAADTSDHDSNISNSQRGRKTMPVFMLTITGRLLALSLIMGFITLIVTYYKLRNTGSRFAEFMDSESVGVRILFSSLGIIVTMFWTSYFQYVALLSPYKLARGRGPHAQKAFHLCPPTNAISGLVRVLTGKHRDLYLGIVASVSLLSEFLPALLANVPYRRIETWLAHSVSSESSQEARMSIDGSV
ncbi:hypothetical protein TruAng_003931 [Truncatella angustata]|nr:hypothetical protein TruAng_003931 [Truncatella angustata]